MYRDTNVKPWKSGSYIPPGYATRYSNKRTGEALDDLPMEKGNGKEKTVDNNSHTEHA